MDFSGELLRDLTGAADAEEFLRRLVEAAAGRVRCPSSSAYRLDGSTYRRVAVAGKPSALPAELPALPPTARTARNVLLPGPVPDRPPAFLRLEWDSPRIHDSEAVEALESACVAAAEIYSKL